MRTLRLAILGLLLNVLAGCVTSPPPAPPPTSTAQPELVPKVEPRAAKGNPPFYDVFGKRYFVLPTAEGYVERGVASWYGPGFHALRTATGESYDMYAMSGAHRTLPLPCYVQVTNLKNGRSVVVRLNDRGPFKDGRIIDLSHTAATKLDMVQAGTALVEVRALTPGSKITSPEPVPASELFVQAGAFTSSANADRMVQRLRAQGYEQAQVREDVVDGKHYFRVRVGPIPSVADFDRVVARLKSFGIADARLALD